jgi:hypothetical protein
MGAIMLVKTLNEEMNSARVRLFAALLGVFLVAGIGTFAGTRVVAAQASDAGCLAVPAALDKLYATAFHMYAIQTGAGIANGKPLTSRFEWIAFG